VLIQHRTHAISQITALCRGKAFAQPPRKELVEAPDMGAEIVPDSQESELSIPSYDYPRLAERGLEVMTEWSRAAARDRNFKPAQTHLPLSYITPHLPESLLRHPYGNLFYRGLLMTGVKWGALPPKNQKQHLSTHTGNLVSAIYVHNQYLRPHINKGVVRELRLRLLSTILRYMPKFPGYWDGVMPTDEDGVEDSQSQIEPSQRAQVLSVPVRLALDTLAGKANEDAAHVITQICRLLCSSSAMGILTDDGYVLSPQIHDKASALFMVCNINYV
jgi:hypothetical protein